MYVISNIKQQLLPYATTFTLNLNSKSAVAAKTCQKLNKELRSVYTQLPLY